MADAAPSSTPQNTSSYPRVWMITGASRGIGARIAEAALAQGDAVIATSRDAASIEKRFGGHDALLPLALDVTDEAQARHVAGAALDRFGRIDVLVNNAGYGLLGAVEEATADEVLRLYDTNVFGLLHVTRAVLPAMRARRAGHVVNISSLGGVQSAVYAVEVSKSEYYAYTTEEREKTEVFALAERMGGDLEGAIRRMASERGTETPEVTIRTIIDNA